MAIWKLCANLLIPNCLRSNLSYSPLAALELYKLISVYFDWLILELEKNKAEDIDEDLIDYRLSVLYQYDK